MKFLRLLFSSLLFILLSAASSLLFAQLISGTVIPVNLSPQDSLIDVYVDDTNIGSALQFGKSGEGAGFSLVEKQSFSIRVVNPETGETRAEKSVTLQPGLPTFVYYSNGAVVPLWYPSGGSVPLTIVNLTPRQRQIAITLPDGKVVTRIPYRHTSALHEDVRSEEFLNRLLTVDVDGKKWYGAGGYPVVVIERDEKAEVWTQYAIDGFDRYVDTEPVDFKPRIRFANVSRIAVGTMVDNQMPEGWDIIPSFSALSAREAVPGKHRLDMVLEGGLKERWDSATVWNGETTTIVAMDVPGAFSYTLQTIRTPHSSILPVPWRGEPLNTRFAVQFVPFNFNFFEKDDSIVILEIYRPDGTPIAERVMRSMTVTQDMSSHAGEYRIDLHEMSGSLLRRYRINLEAGKHYRLFLTGMELDDLSLHALSLLDTGAVGSLPQGEIVPINEVGGTIRIVNLPGSGRIVNGLINGNGNGMMEGIGEGKASGGASVHDGDEIDIRDKGGETLDEFEIDVEPKGVTSIFVVPGSAPLNEVRTITLGTPYLPASLLGSDARLRLLNLEEEAGPVDITFQSGSTIEVIGNIGSGEASPYSRMPADEVTILLTRHNTGDTILTTSLRPTRQTANTLIFTGSVADGTAQLVQVQDDPVGTQDVRILHSLSSVPSESVVAGVSIRPHPLEGKGTLVFNLKESCDATVELFNAQGALVKRLIRQRLVAGDQLIELDTEALPAGVYTLALVCGSERVSVQKIIRVNE